MGKSAEAEPAGTVTDSGTASEPGALFDTRTGVPPWGAVRFSRTVQIVLAFGESTAAEHTSEEGIGAPAITDTVTGMADPFSAAVIVAV
jgi:hypothetical protein